MSDLKSLYEEIKEAERFINRDPEDIPLRTRAGIMALMNQKKVEVEKLKQEFNDQVSKRIVAVCLSGEFAQEALPVIREVASFVVVDTRKLFDDTVNTVKRQLNRHKEFGTNEYVTVLTDARILAADNNTDLKESVFKGAVSIQNDKHLNEVVYSYFAEMVPMEVLAKYVEKVAVQELLNEKLFNKFVPIVVIGGDEKYVTKLGSLTFNHKHVVLCVDSALTDESKTQITETITKSKALLK